MECFLVCARPWVGDPGPPIRRGEGGREGGEEGGTKRRKEKRRRSGMSRKKREGRRRGRKREGKGWRVGEEEDEEEREEGGGDPRFGHSVCALNLTFTVGDRLHDKPILQTGTPATGKRIVGPRLVTASPPTHLFPHL